MDPTDGCVLDAPSRTTMGRMMRTPRSRRRKLQSMESTVSTCAHRALASCCTAIRCETRRSPHVEPESKPVKRSRCCRSARCCSLLMRYAMGPWPACWRTMERWSASARRLSNFLPPKVRIRMDIDLNADLAEGYGPWRMGDDEALLDVLSSANLACGFHAGDPAIMQRTVKLAMARGVDIGAHVGFPDRQGFGRRVMQIDVAELAPIVIYQLGALYGICRALGGRMTHMSFHGALGNR